MHYSCPIHGPDSGPGIWGALSSYLLGINKNFQDGSAKNNYLTTTTDVQGMPAIFKKKDYIMKLLISFSIVFSALAASAQERVFDCSAIKLSQQSVRPEGSNIDQHSQVVLRQKSKQVSLQVGDLFFETQDSQGPAVVMKSSLENQNLVRYDFWIDGSYEYEMAVNLQNHKAKVFWWGLGERVLLGDFQCDVSVQ